MIEGFLSVVLVLALVIYTRYAGSTVVSTGTSTTTSSGRTVAWAEEQGPCGRF